MSEEKESDETEPETIVWQFIKYAMIRSASMFVFFFVVSFFIPEDAPSAVGCASSLGRESRVGVDIDCTLCTHVYY